MRPRFQVTSMTSHLFFQRNQQVSTNKNSLRLTTYECKKFLRRWWWWRRWWCRLWNCWWCTWWWRRWWRQFSIPQKLMYVVISLQRKASITLLMLLYMDKAKKVLEDPLSPDSDCEGEVSFILSLLSLLGRQFYGPSCRILRCCNYSYSCRIIGST